MQRMRHLLEYLQGENCSRGGGPSTDKLQVYGLFYLKLFSSRLVVSASLRGNLHLIGSLYLIWLYRFSIKNEGTQKGLA